MCPNEMVPLQIDLAMGDRRYLTCPLANPAAVSAQPPPHSEIHPLDAGHCSCEEADGYDRLVADWVSGGHQR
jgi:hypothetical protein